MLRNYFKVAVRNLFANQIFSIISVAGLAMGLACSILIMLFVKDELSFDKFHKNGDRIWQLTCDRIEKDGRDEKFAIAAMVQAPAFASGVPEIEAFTRVAPKQATVHLDKKSFIETVTWADDSFFSIFSFSLLNGNARTALRNMHAVVLSENAAKKYFNSSDIIGRTLEIETDGGFKTFIVTAVAKNAPENSSIQFDLVLPFAFLEKTNPDNGWMWVSYPTYFLLKPNSNIGVLEKKMQRVYELEAHDEIAMNHEAGYDNYFRWSLHLFARMHLNTEFKGGFAASDPFYSTILGAIAIFILLIAILNFINLTLSGSLKRNKEIGVRKVMGGTREQLATQFLMESLVFCFVAFVVAIGVVWLILPFFNQLAGKHIDLAEQADVKLLVLLSLLFLVTGFLGGIYPALVLSKTGPVAILQGRQTGTRPIMKKTFVVVQFVISTFFILLVWVMFDQFHFLNKTDLGYNDRDLIEFTFENGVMNKAAMDAAASEFARIPGVIKTGYYNIGKFGGKTIANLKLIDAVYQRVDDGYLETIGAHLVSGRHFSKSFPADAANAVLINETFAREAGWMDALGHSVDYMNIPEWGDKKIFIIGVVKDFHAESLKEKIKPMIYTMDHHLPMGRLVVRTYTNANEQTRNSMEMLYQSLFPGHPFRYSYRQDLNNAAYASENRWKTIITAGALLAVFISAIGLFAISLSDTNSRAKEIAIRKVLGARAGWLMMQMVWNFAKLVIVGFLIGAPMAFFAAHEWLQGFAYHVKIGWVSIVGPCMIVLLLAVTTTVYQCVKISLANPAIFLKQE